MGEFMQDLDFPELRYLTQAKKEISELNITNEYKNALIKCIEKMFNPNQLLNDIYLDEYQRKIILAERDLVSTRFLAKKDDVILSKPYQIENNILRLYRAYLSRKLK